MRMSKAQAQQWMVKFYKIIETRGDAFPCEHGHLGCSVYTGGGCSDEIAAIADIYDEE